MKEKIGQKSDFFSKKLKFFFWEKSNFTLKNRFFPKNWFFPKIYMFFFLKKSDFSQKTIQVFLGKNAISAVKI
jgi:hypothetical protein